MWWMTQVARADRLPDAAHADTGSADAHSEARYTPLIRTAKLVCGSGEFLCVVSEVSAAGVSVRLFHPLPGDKLLHLVMPNDDSLPLEVEWEKAGRAGFRFAGAVDLEQVIAGRSEWPKRPIRLNLELPVEVWGLAGRCEATLRNISSQGAQIECASRMAIDQHLRMKVRGLPEIEAKVRWRTGTFHGLAFDSLIQFADLARTAGLVQGIFPERVEA